MDVTLSYLSHILVPPPPRRGRRITFANQEEEEKEKQERWEVWGGGEGKRANWKLEVGRKKNKNKNKTKQNKQIPHPFHGTQPRKTTVTRDLGVLKKKKKEQVPTFGPTSLQDPFTTPLDEFIQQETHVRQHEAANVETKEFRRVAGRQLETDVRG